MKTGFPKPFQNHFPETPEECREWRSLTLRRAMAMRVLAVAHTRIEGTWSAYCDAVPGEDHSLEEEGVLRRGDKLDESVALALFPQFKGIPYAE